MLVLLLVAVVPSGTGNHTRALISVLLEGKALSSAPILQASLRDLQECYYKEVPQGVAL